MERKRPSGTGLSGDLHLPSGLWIYFPFFLLSYFILTYQPLTPSVRLWVVLLGLVLPMGLAILGTNSTDRKMPWKKETLAPFPLWAAGTLMVVAFLLRFWGLRDPVQWFIDDESFLGVMAIERSHHWQWGLFDNFSESSNLSSFCSTPFFWFSDSPFLCLRFPTALLSMMTLVAGFFLARRYFSRSFSAVLASLWALGYWPVWLGRFTHPAGWLPLWEMAVFHGLAGLSEEKEPRRMRLWGLGTGALLGLGPLAFTPWLAMLPLAVLVLFLKGRREGRSILPPLLLFSVSFLLTLSPFLVHVFRHGFGYHLWGVSLLNSPSALSGLLGSVWNYLSVVFWGATGGICLPVSGGFLNFLWGAAWSVGVVALTRRWSHPLSKWAVFGSFLFFLPGFLSTGMESLRILLALPFLVFGAALGLQCLLEDTRPGWRLPLLSVFLVLSTVVDMDRALLIRGRLLDPLGGVPRDIRWDSYSVLRDLAEKAGPGAVFPELIPETVDYSLLYSTYPFNADWNPRFREQDIHWVALFTGSHFQPYLSRRFPQMRWIGLPLGRTDGRYGLAVLPPGSVGGASDLAHWRDFYPVWRQVLEKTTQLPNGRSRGAILRRLSLAYPSIPEDPFLQSCFFEKLAFNYSWVKTFHPEDLTVDWGAYGDLFQMAVKKGVQDADIYEKFGKLLVVESRWKEAQGALRKALRFSPGNPWLTYELEQAELKKTAQ